MGARLSTISGLCGAALAFVGPLVFGLVLRSDFDPVSQYISELGARGAPLAAWVNYVGFFPTGLLTLLFALAVLPSLPALAPTRAAAMMVGVIGLGYILSAFFPCDPGCPAFGRMSVSQLVHNLLFVPYAILAPLGVWLFGGRFSRSESWRSLWVYSRATAVVMAVSVIAMLLPMLAPYRGLLQWGFEGGFFLWLAVVNVQLLRLRRLKCDGIIWH